MQLKCAKSGNVQTSDRHAMRKIKWKQQAKCSKPNAASQMQQAKCRQQSPPPSPVPSPNPTPKPWSLQAGLSLFWVFETSFCAVSCLTCCSPTGRSAAPPSVSNQGKGWNPNAQEWKGSQTSLSSAGDPGRQQSATASQTATAVDGWAAAPPDRQQAGTPSLNAAAAKFSPATLRMSSRLLTPGLLTSISA